MNENLADFSRAGQLFYRVKTVALLLIRTARNTCLLAHGDHSPPLRRAELSLTKNGGRGETTRTGHPTIIKAFIINSFKN
jgi:hypothetical protein